MDRTGGDVSVSRRDVIQATLDAFGREVGLSKSSNTWYLRQAETIAVINLQRSQYGAQYYVNVALWLLPLGDADKPKENVCHVRTRLDDLLPPERAARVPALFDLDTAVDEEARRDEILSILRSDLLPVLKACATVDGLRSVAGERLVKRSLVNRAAQELLRATPGG